MTKESLQQIKARYQGVSPEFWNPDDIQQLLTLIEQQQAEIEQKKVIADTLGDLLKEQGKEITRLKAVVEELSGLAKAAYSICQSEGSGMEQKNWEHFGGKLRAALSSVATLNSEKGKE